VTRVGVLGAGSWGTTLADLLARHGHAVRLWAHEGDVADAINTRRENPVFLAGHTLAPGLAATNDTAEAVSGAELVLLAAPSHVARDVLRQARAAIGHGTIVVSATKGIETDTLALMHEVIAAELPAARAAVLSGPSFAKEVADGQPTAVVAAAGDPATAEAVQRVFAGPRFRVYTAADVTGVELAGALKNVVAIAAGMLEGLGLGSNPRAALLTRGLAEIARLGVRMGADPLTFAGLAGMGDLILTATGQLSRNRALGQAIAQGETLAAYQARHRTVAEGVNTSKAGAALAAREGVEMPIAAKVCEILFNGKSAADSVDELMGRGLKAEQWQ
jgi:glycerol-3-phosphate dehydrogenase (NAD(P)+)